MQNYCSYLPANPQDVAWGLTVLNTGCTRILPHSVYPLPNHPAAFGLKWENGRVLPEYQLLYITRGEGFFESGDGRHIPVGPGTVMVVTAGERHRYKPRTETGWDEYWVGFNGPAIRSLRESGLLDPPMTTFQVGPDDRLLSLFQEIIDETKRPKPGSQSLLSGALLHLLGYIHSRSQKLSVVGHEMEEMVKRAQLLFRNSLDERTTPEQVAEEIGISYSRFRKLFKAYTGLAPGQYQIQLRIQRAKDLLRDPGKSIKEIAFALNFESSFYFSKLFKEKTGQSPQEYRRSSLGIRSLQEKPMRQVEAA